MAQEVSIHDVASVWRLTDSCYQVPWQADSAGANLSLQRGVGVAGDPVPYTIRGDSMMSVLLIVCFVLFVVAVAQSKRMIVRQLKSFFFLPREDDFQSDTSTEVRLMLFLVLVDCLVLAITSYLFAKEIIAEDYLTGSDVVLVALQFGMFIAYFLLHWLLYTVVDGVFFGGKKNLQFIHAKLFLTAAEGVLLFPLVLLQVYFDLSVENALFYFAVVLFLNKILTFYKCWVIFFRKKDFFLQIFLYFCALEIVPLLAFSGAWLIVMDFLKIKF